MDRLCLILTGGSGAPEGALPPADLVIAADSGADVAAALGLRVDVVIGDFDSADPRAVAGAVESGATLESHPVDKDATDLDLALHGAAERAATRTIVLGGGGNDRLDHVLANAGVIAADRHAAIGPEWWVGPARAKPVRGKHLISGRPGDLVSIVPVSGTCSVTTGGLRWALEGEPLPLGSTRAVSNEMTGDTAEIEVLDGVAFVIHLGGGR